MQKIKHFVCFYHSILIFCSKRCSSSNLKSGELKILDDKIEANQAQYDLGREAAKISALSSKDLLEIYEYLTGEDLGHRPSLLEKTKFEYSPLGMSLSKSFKRIMLKILLRATVILIATGISINCTVFTKGMTNLKRCH